MDEKEISIRDLYPGLTDEQYDEAEKTFKNYVSIISQIFERVYREKGPEAAAKLARGELDFLD